MTVRVAVHLGFHATEEERLLRCLLRNAQALAVLGVAVTQPALYHQLLRTLSPGRADPGRVGDARGLTQGERTDGPRDRRRLANALLARCALPGLLEVEVDLPGWTGATAARVTEGYAADVAALAALPGVALIAP